MQLVREQVQSARDRPFTLRQTSSSGTSGLHVLKHQEAFWENWRRDMIGHYNRPVVHFSLRAGTDVS